MKNCTNCGSAMDDNAAFCANCGTPVAPAQPIAPEPPVVEMQQNTYQTNPNQNPYQTNPAPTYNQNGGYNPYAQPTQSMNIPGLVGRKRDQAQVDQTVPAANQWQGRTIQPDPPGGMGLRPSLPQ